MPLPDLPAGSEIKLLIEPVLQLRNRNANLLHRVTVTDRNRLVVLGIEIVADAVRCSDFILTAISLADCSAVIKIAVVAFGKLCKNLLCGLGELFGQRKNRNLYGRNGRMEVHDVTYGSVRKLLLIVGFADERKGHTVAAK